MVVGRQKESVKTERRAQGEKEKVSSGQGHTATGHHNNEAQKKQVSKKLLQQKQTKNAHLHPLLISQNPARPRSHRKGHRRGGARCDLV